MKKELQELKEIFKCEITDNDIDKKIDEVLEWDSYTIMSFMAEMFERYQVTIGVEEVSAISMIGDLVELMEKCRKGKMQSI